MHDMYAHTSYRLYTESGSRHAQEIAALFRRHITKDNPTVAEWGCGLARVIQRMPEDFIRHGFDFNQDAILWCRLNVPNVHFHCNSLMPPLPIADQTFDGVYCLSVFTHLSEKAHFAWINELSRVLKPGGVLVASFHGRDQAHTLRRCERRAFDAGELVVRDRVDEGSRLYVAYHPDAFVRTLLSMHFTIVEGPLQALDQSVWVARTQALASPTTPHS